MDVLATYHNLLSEYGPQGWWPRRTGDARAGFDPIFEILVGCVLTQNTSWQNVEKTIAALYNRKLLAPKAIAIVRAETLRRIVKPSGYFNQKTRKLKILARAILDEAEGNSTNFIASVSRDALLSLWGVGPETADSMLLYAGGRAEFVIDTYTKRLCAHHGVVCDSYDEYKIFFSAGLPLDAGIFNEYHALIVRWGKEKSRKHKPTEIIGERRDV